MTRHKKCGYFKCQKDLISVPRVKGKKFCNGNCRQRAFYYRVKATTGLQPYMIHKAGLTLESAIIIHKQLTRK